MEINLNKIVAIKCYKKREYNWYHISEKGTYWWRFLGIIPIYKYTQKENLYNNYFGSDRWLTREEFINSFNKDFWKENYVDTNGLVYEKPSVVIWLVGDSNIGSYHCASVIKFFETVDAALDYKNNLITDCQSKGIYLKEL